MITIRDGDIYQWDSGRQIEVDSDVCEVHFASCNSKDAYVTVPVDGVCNIPNILLQTGEDFVIYAVCQKDECEQTVEHLRVWVKQRAKPSDYVYTETEVFDYKELEERIKQLEDNGGSSGGSGVQDVQVNGVSIVNDGVANIPIANAVNVLGLVKYKSGYGVRVDTEGLLMLDVAQVTNIDKRSVGAYPITCERLDYAIKQAMTDGKGAQWTSQEKASARERMGVGEWHALFETTLSEPVGSVTINTDMNGKPFQVEELIIIIENCKVENTRIRIVDTTNKHEDFVNIYYSVAKTDNVYKYIFEIGQQIDGTHRVERHFSSNTGTLYENVSNPPFTVYSKRNVKYLTRLQIDNNGGNFSEGTRIWVGGR